MQAQISIEFDKLVQLAKQLPLEKWMKLKEEVENTQAKAKDNADMEALLLNAPTFSEKQLEKISNTRKKIDEWRSK